MIDPTEVAVVLLAAGLSERFGSDKLLAPLDAVPLGLHAARRLSALKTGWRIAVCRDGSPLIGELINLGFEVSINPNPERGLSSSLSLGIDRAEQTDAKAALVALGDMPFVSPSHFSALLAAFDESSSPIVASSLEGVGTPPALFGRAYFKQLREANGDKGGRHLLSNATLVATDPATLADIDRPEDIP